MVGDELLQFGTAEPLGDRRWRLSRLSRGRRGTEAAIGAQQAGDRFVLLTPEGVRTIDLPLAALGGTVRVMATGTGDGDGFVATTVLDGRSVRPLSPVHLCATTAAEGGVTLSWVRRSRAGWRWIDGVDAPLAEETESYRVSLTGGDGAVRALDVGAPSLVLAATDLPVRPLRIEVRQRGTMGLSEPLSMILT